MEKEKARFKVIPKPVRKQSMVTVCIGAGCGRLVNLRYTSGLCRKCRRKEAVRKGRIAYKIRRKLNKARRGA